MKTVPVLVLDLDDDLARIMVVDANRYRKKFYPSELAFAFKMRFEAEKHRGKKDGSGEETADHIGKDYGYSQRNVYNYMKLTQLMPELLRYVDEKKLVCSAALELTDLSTDMQRLLVSEYEEDGLFPNLLQAKRIKAKGTFDSTWLREVLLEQEKPQKKNFSLADLARFFPENYSDEEKIETIEELLEQWSREREQRAL